MFILFIFGGGNVANRKRSELNNNKAVNVPEVLTYSEQMQEIFIDLYEQWQVSNKTKRERFETIDAIFERMYKQLFKPDTTTQNNCHSKLKTYDVNTIESILDTYIELCKVYGGCIKYITFCNMTGISYDTIWLWHKSNNTKGYIFYLNQNDIDIENNTQYIYINNNSNVIDNINNNNCRHIDKDRLSCLRFDCYKKIQEHMNASNDNGLNASDTGVIVIANNSTDIPKQWDAKRQIVAEQVKQIASAQQLPRFELTEKHTQFITKNE